MVDTTPLPARKPSSRYHHGDLRRALVREAARTIAEDGVDALTLREAGKRLGVSRTALYRHFSDKAALLAAVAREGFQGFRADLQQAWHAGEGTHQGLESMGVAYVRFAVTHPAHYRVMFGDYRHLCEKDPDLQADAASAFQVLADGLVSLQHLGLIRRDDPRMLAQYIWAIVHGIAMLAIDGQLGPHPLAKAELTALVDFSLTRLRTGIELEATPGRRRARR